MALDIEEEARFFSAQDSELTRSMAWNAIPQFHKKIQGKFDLIGAARKHLAGKQNLQALTLACGDMKSEYQMLSKLDVGHIDAYDIASEKKKDFFSKYYDDKRSVEYFLQDLNSIKLPKAKYDVVYMQQSYHHIKEVEHLAEQIRQAMKPDGVFLLIDYVGPNFLQRSEKQLAVARRLWTILPERLRKHPNGKVVKEVFIPPKATLSPCEAVNSGAILPALKRHFDFQESLLYGGILYPVFNGFAQNYTQAEDLFLQSMWDMDEVLLENDVVEPNFIRAIMTPKASVQASTKTATPKGLKPLLRRILNGLARRLE